MLWEVLAAALYVAAAVALFRAGMLLGKKREKKRAGVARLFTAIESVALSYALVDYAVHEEEPENLTTSHAAAEHYAYCQLEWLKDEEIGRQSLLKEKQA